MARLLRIANSSFYGLRRKVVSVRDAVFVLGMGNIRNLALAAAVSGPVGSPCRGVGDQSEGFWRHGVATALCAGMLAGRMKCSGDGAFAAGLLHDLSAAWLLPAGFPGTSRKCAACRQSQDCLLQDAEVEVLGIDHSAIGRQLAESWGFPDALCVAVGGHHDAGSLSAAPLARWCIWPMPLPIVSMWRG